MKYLIDGEEVELQHYEERLWGEIYRDEAASWPTRLSNWSSFSPHEQGLVIAYSSKEKFVELKTQPKVELFSTFEQINESQES